MGLEKPVEKQYDINLLFVLFLFAVISCFYLYYAQQIHPENFNFSLRQMFFYVLAFITAFVILHFDFEYYLFLHWFLYGAGLLMLVILDVAAGSGFAPERMGATRWFDLPLIGNFQPSEFMKVFMVLTMSTLIYKHNQNYAIKVFKNDLWLVVKLLAVLIPPVLLLMRQPDMGMIMMMLAIFVGLVLVSGIAFRLLAVLFGVPVLLFSFFIFAFFRFPQLVEQYIFQHLPSYQVSRFYGWLNPLEYSDEGFQTARAMSALGSGRLTGSEGTSVYIPEAHTDFIFAVIGEEHGFIAAALVITLYFVLLYQMMMIALRCHHRFGAYICAGIIAMLAFQVFQNVGMNLGLLPVTGFTLPLISYGGSSLLATMLAIGLVLSVRYHSKSYFFENPAK
ncbi:FtsW/RodA/SpoVE family cell cycle protein [Salsuginibacillus kocurii]|uniref:FtsW/RodA/SpoVE family cell cycle protein n=1 Tax=Salsuginibacillus kocurii TaxID=427078 RepID=UPI00037B8003|nr:FtsW/RodA/SpoVE family cell cycle protein [Salsuginibacillus kocurii]